ncbi:MAG: restriction endonuclease subunit S [Massilibacteroides sp.]|nr:restriction endonuclease subunit S [Massilibacteroides sp.]
MKQYKEYKDSGVKWIGMMPKHWEVKTLRAFIRLYSEKNHAEKQLLSVTREQGVISRDVESKEENHNYIPDDLSGYKLVRKGDFVINKMKSWQGSYGVSNYEGIVSPAYYVCKLEFENKDFFSKSIRSKAYVPFFNQYSKGIRVDQWDLSPIALKNISFFEPPLSEQNEIVAYLDNKVSKIDRYISTAERKILALEELKQVTIADAVTHGINPNAPMKDSGIPWIGMVPEHWKLTRIKFLFNDISEKEHPEEPCLCSTQKYGVIPQSMYENRVVVVNKGLENLKFVRKGNFVISLRSFQGGIEIAHYQGIISAAYTILSLGNKNISSNYIKYLFKSSPFIQLLQTCVTGIREGQNINYELLRRQFIPIPTLSQQNEIVAYIDRKVAQIDKMKVAELAQIEKLKEYKQRLISDVVTGKVKVTND